MSNNKAPGKDNINIELIKYAPEEVHQEISEILNGILETNNEEVKLGTGVLLSLPKPKKTQGPVENLQPRTLFETIRNIISKIFMNRTEDKINRCVAQSQSRYRKSRSTADIIWAHKWIIVETQIQEITIYVTGIDMSSAFDTIQRDQLIDIVKEILNEDEIRILRVLLVETTLKVKVENAQTTKFESNIGSLQGDNISGRLFKIYFNHALQQLREEIRKESIDVRDIDSQWTERVKNNLPDEIMYAYDCYFITELEQKKERIYQKAKTILTNKNLPLNEDKTEHTTIKRKEMETEEE